MTAKRFNKVKVYLSYEIFDNDNNKQLDVDSIVDLLNKLNDENEQLKYNLSAHMVDLNNYKGKCSALEIENEQLKTQLQNTSDQRDEFHRGARENANRIGKLEKENEQLKHDATVLIQANQDYRKENERLKQFKEDVFNKIDMHLRMLPTARDNEFDEDDGDPSLYVGAIYMLETLKKELEE